jgi:hypothetical protein
MKHQYPAYLFLEIPGQYFPWVTIMRGPPKNFWNWTYRARKCWILKRWPSCRFANNGDPFDHPLHKRMLFSL